jgi:hypothetical protein
MTAETNNSINALEHIKHLAENIGGRGSCTPAEREAGAYVADQLHLMGVNQVRRQEFKGAPSTYRPFVLAFSTALIGTILVWTLEGRLVLFLGSVLNALGAFGMLAETDISPSWMRWFLPKGDSLNVIGIVPAAGETRRKAILCAHLDTHRTPIFYSSPTWHKLFGLLVAAGLLSMLLTGIFYALGAVLDWEWVRWVGLALATMVIFSFILCLHADFTPYSPGANDNASGVATVLKITEQLLQTPLENTEVWSVFTGCEEVGAYGMQSFLEAYQGEVNNEVVFITLDEVGFGIPKFISQDGIIRKRETHPLAIKLARQAARSLPNLKVLEKAGIAYTDALAATKRGLISLSIGTHADPQMDEVSHWHQMSDSIETINPQTLAHVQAFTWNVLIEIDHWNGNPEVNLDLEQVP